MKRGIVFIATKERLDNIRTPKNRRKKLFILVRIYEFMLPIV